MPRNSMKMKKNLYKAIKTSQAFENEWLFDSASRRRVANFVLFWCFCTKNITKTKPR